MPYRALGRIAAALVLIAGWAGAAHGEGLRFFHRGEDPNRLSLSVGMFNFNDEREHQSAMITGEFLAGYRFISIGEWFKISPKIGGFATADGGVMGYGGLFLEIPLGRTLFRGFVDVGAYDEGGGRPLGSTALFNVGAEYVYELPDGWQFGLRYSHQSNGGVLNFSGSSNPGSDNALLTVSMPLEKLF